MGVEIEINTPGLDALSDRLQSGLPGAMEQAAEALATRARDAAPVDTGELRDSIEARSDGTSAEVVATAPHAAFQRRFLPEPTEASDVVSEAFRAGLMDGV